MYRFSENSKKRLETLTDSYLKKILNEAIKVSPIDFGIPWMGGIRSAEEQLGLFKKGRKKVGGVWVVRDENEIVTYSDGYINKSHHQTGKAFDVVPYVGGQYTWDAYYMAMIAGVILSVAAKYKIDLVWGGTFGTSGKALKGWDKGHYQTV